MGKTNARRLLVVALLVVAAAFAIAMLYRSGDSPTRPSNALTIEPPQPRFTRAVIPASDRATAPQQREQLARELEAAAEAPPVDEYPDAVEAGLIEDANEHMIEAVRPCVRAATQPVPLHWMARFQYVVVIARDQARLENIETINTNLNDPTLFECVKDAITKLRWRSRGDARISAEMTVPLGSLDGPR